MSQAQRLDLVLAALPAAEPACKLLPTRTSKPHIKEYRKIHPFTSRPESQVWRVKAELSLPTFCPVGSSNPFPNC